MDTRTLIGTIVLIVAMIPAVMRLWRLTSDHLLRRSGVTIDASVVEVRDMQRRFFIGPEVEIRVRFQLGGQVVETSYLDTLSAVDLARLQPGSSVSVVYDPDKPSRVASAQP